jgi:hypothetical protein
MLVGILGGICVIEAFVLIMNYFQLRSCVQAFIEIEQSVRKVMALALEEENLYLANITHHKEQNSFLKNDMLVEQKKRLAAEKRLAELLKESQPKQEKKAP